MFRNLVRLTIPGLIVCFLVLVVNAEQNYSSRKLVQLNRHQHSGFTAQGAATNIIGGINAPDGRFPYVCQYSYVGKEIDGSCGGTLIDSRYVMTAAHCLVDEYGSRTVTEIRCGSIIPQTAKKADIFMADEIIVHEDFDPPTTRLLFDIALIKLDRNATLDLPEMQKDDLEDQTEVYAAGWGEFDDSEKSSPNLRVAQMLTINNEKCSEIWTERFPSLIIDEGRLCAGITEARTCYGDSGGPLLLMDASKRGNLKNGKPKKDTVVGIVSFGECDGDFPAVFTRVSHFKDWIKEKMENGSN